MEESSSQSGGMFSTAYAKANAAYAEYAEYWLGKRRASDPSSRGHELSGFCTAGAKCLRSVGKEGAKLVSPEVYWTRSTNTVTEAVSTTGSVDLDEGDADANLAPLPQNWIHAEASAPPQPPSAARALSADCPPAVVALQKAVKDCPDAAWATQGVCERYLDWGAGDVATAAEHLSETLRWREGFGVRDLAARASVIRREAQTGKLRVSPCTDNEGHPVLVITPALENTGFHTG